MPIRERLAAKEIHRDWRRLRSISGVSGGAVAPHTLLGIVHSDAAIYAPTQGALIVADSTPEWTGLAHPLATGYALVTDATDVAWDVTPEWRGRHSWHDGVAVTSYVDEDGSAWFTGNVAIGPTTVGASELLRLRNLTLDFAGAAYYGINSFLTKTAGASTAADAFNGYWSQIQMNQAGGTIGNMYGALIQSRLDAGGVGDGGTPADMHGVNVITDLNGGQVYDDVFGVRSLVDQEAGNTVSGDMIAVAARMDADGTVTGTTYLVLMEGLTGVDYGIYETGVTSNYLQNDTKIGGTAGASAQLDVDQSLAGGAQPVLRLDQGDVSEQHIVVSMNGADQDFPAILQLDVTGDPTLWWDESESRLIWDEHLGLSAGNLYFASTYGIDHADDAAGDYLVLQGGLYVPGTLPGGFTGFANPTASVGLVAVNGVATTAMRSDAAPPLDQGIIPTWTGIHTHAANVILDDGVTHSPQLLFVGGQNDDTAEIRLIDDAVAGNSDLAITLVADDADARLLIRNNSGATVAWIDAVGDADFSDVTIDEYLIHDGDADTFLRFQDDNITLDAGGVSMVDIVEGAVDYVNIPQGVLYVNDTSNANMNQGLTINQGGNGNEIFAVKSSDVAHGMTAQLETDTYGIFSKFEDTSGGFMITGAKDADGANHSAIRLRGFLGEPPQTSKTAASYGVVTVGGWEKDGTNVKAIAAAGSNLFSVDNNGDTVMIIDIEGDIHLDAASGDGTNNTVDPVVNNDVIGYYTFDAWDDAQLARALDVALHPDEVIRSEFDEFVQYGRADLERARIVSFNDDGHHFVNTTQLQRLHNGAIWQLYQRCQRYERALIELGASPALLEA